MCIPVILDIESLREINYISNLLHLNSWNYKIFQTSTLNRWITVQRLPLTREKRVRAKRKKKYLHDKKKKDQTSFLAKRTLFLVHPKWPPKRIIPPLSVLLNREWENLKFILSVAKNLIPHTRRPSIERNKKKEERERGREGRKKRENKFRVGSDVANRVLAGHRQISTIRPQRTPFAQYRRSS